MNIIPSLTLPPGYSLMSLYQSPPQKDGSRYYNIYIQRDGLGPFKGSMGDTPQQAVDKALALLRDWEQNTVPESKGPLSGLKLKLDLSSLRRTE